MKTFTLRRLSPIVRNALHDQNCEVTGWRSEEISGGTVGKVFRISGTARCASAPKARKWTLILKEQKQWARFGDPGSWQREMQAYRSGLFDTLPPGMKVPRCLEIEEPGPRINRLWLEHVTGANDSQMGLEHYAAAARALAHFQGPYLSGKPLPSYPWLSTSHFQAFTVGDWGTGAIPALAGFPNRRRQTITFHKGIINDAMQLWHRRDPLLDALHTLPRTLCHRDYNPGNLFVSAKKGGAPVVTVIDWDCLGAGNFGEDLADLVCEGLVYYKFDPGKAAALKETAVSAYLSGLRETGWKGGERSLRSVLAASVALQWCFRVICLARAAGDPAARERLTGIFRFILDQARDAHPETF